MLTALGTGVRFRIAIGFAVFAALCFTLPPAVMAMGHGADTVACLSHADAAGHSVSGAPERADAGGAKHGDHQMPAGDDQMTCCGLFCLSALVEFSRQASEPAVIRTPRGMASTPRLLSRTPTLPERPPNTLLFV